MTGASAAASMKTALPTGRVGGEFEKTSNVCLTTVAPGSSFACAFA